MLKTDLERLKAGISFFKLMKGKEDNTLVLKYFWNFLSLVELYINGGQAQINSEPEAVVTPTLSETQVSEVTGTPATFEEAQTIFNSPEQLPITT